VPCWHRPVTHRPSASSDIGSARGQSSKRQGFFVEDPKNLKGALDER